MRTDQARRLKETERENARLKQLVADLSLDNVSIDTAVCRVVSPTLCRTLQAVFRRHRSKTQARQQIQWAGSDARSFCLSERIAV